MPVIFQPAWPTAVWTTTLLERAACSPVRRVTRNACQFRLASIGATRSQHPVSTNWYSSRRAASDLAVAPRLVASGSLLPGRQRGGGDRRAQVRPGSGRTHAAAERDLRHRPQKHGSGGQDGDGAEGQPGDRAPRSGHHRKRQGDDEQPGKRPRQRPYECVEPGFVERPQRQRGARSQEHQRPYDDPRVGRPRDERTGRQRDRRRRRGSRRPARRLQAHADATAGHGTAPWRHAPDLAVGFPAGDVLGGSARRRLLPDGQLPARGVVVLGRARHSTTVKVRRPEGQENHALRASTRAAARLPHSNASSNSDNPERSAWARCTGPVSAAPACASAAPQTKPTSGRTIAWP